MVTALILDDEEKARNSLQKIIEMHCPKIELVGTAASGEIALQMIEQHRPQLLFFDIEIARGESKYITTFDLLPQLPNYPYEVVFVTAYNHYALKAIQAHAVGYILKPISIADLIETVKNVIPRIERSGANKRLEDLASQMLKTTEALDRIWVHSNQDIVPVFVKDIIRMEAQGKYTDIYCEGGKMLTSSKNLGEFVSMLSVNNFIKVHRSHLVNLDKVAKFSKSDGGTLVTSDKKEIPVSKQGKERLFEKL